MDSTTLNSSVVALLDEGYLGTQCHIQTGEFYRGEPDNFLHEVSGNVSVFDTSGREACVLGSFVLRQIDVDGAITERESVFDVFDQTQSTMDYFELYEGNGYTLKSRVLKALGCEDYFGLPSGLLIIDRLELRPEYRGHGYGLAAMKSLIMRFRMGAAVVAIKPFPLQFEGKVVDGPEELSRRGLEAYGRDEARCTRRLVTHYGRLGFKRIRGTPFMCLSLVQPLPWDGQE